MPAPFIAAFWEPVRGRRLLAGSLENMGRFAEEVAPQRGGSKWGDGPVDDGEPG
jgi:hypothetical protein